MANLLELSGVAKSYGGIEVFRSVDLTVQAGERLGVLGPNGAGKSTLFNLISGLQRPTKGTIRYDRRDLARLTPWAACKAGIGRTFQIPQPFGDMTVVENVLVGCTNGGGMTLTEARHRATEVLEVAGLGHLADHRAGSLTLLNLKRLELARAVALGPKLLLLDEIAGGLTEAECDTLLNILEKVVTMDMTVIWIEHVVHALTRFVSKIAVLADKRIVTEGPIDTVLAHPDVRELYFGAKEAV